MPSARSVRPQKRKATKRPSPMRTRRRTPARASGCRPSQARPSSGVGADAGALVGLVVGVVPSLTEVIVSLTHLLPHPNGSFVSSARTIDARGSVALHSPTRPRSWMITEMSDYELVDFGAGRRLERFGPLMVDRPCPQAELLERAEPTIWEHADVRFERA